MMRRELLNRLTFKRQSGVPANSQAATVVSQSRMPGGFTSGGPPSGTYRRISLHHAAMMRNNVPLRGGEDGALDA